MVWQHVLFRLLSINTVFRRPSWPGNIILFQAFQDQQSILEGHCGWATCFTLQGLKDQQSI